MGDTILYQLLEDWHTEARTKNGYTLLRKDKDLILIVEAPGVKGSDTRIMLAGDNLIISGETKNSTTGLYHSTYHRIDVANLIPDLLRIEPYVKEGLIIITLFPEEDGFSFAAPC